MLVYGDRAESVAPRERLRALTARLKQAEAALPGPDRHDQLVAAFIDAAGLAQGLADAEFDALGQDDLTPLQEAAMALLIGLARKVTASLWSGFTITGPAVAPELMTLALQSLPERVSIRTPEGYAFYAVDPGGYLKAAAEHPWTAPPLAIGLRSIGTGLAALAAVAARAPAAVTLRPTGHPFQREVRISDALRARLLAHDGPFAIVDEGPGLSGSSFGAAADLLENLGVAPDRIVFLPSHPGAPGPQASEAHQARWAAAARPVATLDDLLEESPITAWFEDLTGPIDHVEDLSGGAWRPARGPDIAPVHAPQERRKFRLSATSGRWLARFAGYGAIGEAKLERARALHREGFTPEPLALRRGFLLERWEDGTPAPAVERGRLVEHLARYLGFRARAFPAEAHEGADARALIEMVRVNAQEELGKAAAPLLARLENLAADPPQIRPVHVDARLHAWEWIETPDGLLLKTDALDHSAAHDLVGAQDIGWDLAGAEVEFDLTPEETAALRDRLAAAGAPRSEALDALYALAYPAFQLGYWRMAELAASAEERPRLAAQAERYAARLRAIIER